MTRIIIPNQYYERTPSELRHMNHFYAMKRPVFGFSVDVFDWVSEHRGCIYSFNYREGMDTTKILPEFEPLYHSCHSLGYTSSSFFYAWFKDEETALLFKLTW